MSRVTTAAWAARWILACAMGASPLAQAGPLLGTADTFAVLGGSTVTNTGATTVDGDLGVSPGSAVTGFPPGLITGGVQHVADAPALQAQSDLGTAYHLLASAAFDADLTGTNLGGLTLLPGVYHFSSSAQLTGTVTLDAQNNPDALFVIQIASTLITASGAGVQLINGAQPCNVFWQVGSSATVGTDTTFVGNILALASITLNTGAAVDGRVLARNGALSMDDNRVTASHCQVPVSGAITVSESFAPRFISPGGTSTLVITFTNTTGTAATFTADWIDVLPAGLTIAPLPGLATTCGGSATVSAVAGSSAIQVDAGRTIPAASSCTVQVTVTAGAGRYDDVVEAGSVQTSGGANALSTSATLEVRALGGGGAVPVPGIPPALAALLALLVGAVGGWRLGSRS